MNNEERLKKELRIYINAYNILNSEHTMMLKELGLNPEIKPTKEIIKKAISSFHGRKSQSD